MNPRIQYLRIADRVAHQVKPDKMLKLERETFTA